MAQRSHMQGDTVVAVDVGQRSVCVREGQVVAKFLYAWEEGEAFHVPVPAPAPVPAPPVPVTQTATMGVD